MNNNPNSFTPINSITFFVFVMCMLVMPISGQVQIDTVGLTHLSMLIYKNDDVGPCMKEYNLQGAGIEYDIPDTIWKDKPDFKVVQMCNQEGVGWGEQIALYITEDNRLFLMVISERICPTGRWPSFYTVYALSELRIPGIDITPATPLGIYTMHAINNAEKEIVLVIGTSGTKLVVVTLRESEIVSVVPGQLTERIAGQEIISFSGGVNDSCLWVTGSHGMVRRITVQYDTSIQEDMFDIISHEEQVLCYGDGYIGTASGAVYTHIGNEFICVTTDAKAPLRYIDSMSAVGDTGTVLINQKGTWQCFTFGRAHYRHCNLVGLPEGSSIELLDDQKRYHRYVYADNPTILQTTQPDSLMTNGGIYTYITQEPEEIILVFSDPEDNTVTPTILLHSDTGAVTLFNSGILGNKIPEQTIGYLGNSNEHLASDKFVVHLTRDSCVITTNYSYLSWDPLFGGLYREYGVYTRNISWKAGNTLTIWSAVDSLTIYYADNVSIFKPVKAPNAFHHDITIYGMGKTIGIRNATVPCLVRIYNIKGMQLFKKWVYGNDTIIFTIQNKGLYIITASSRQKVIKRNVMVIK